MIGILPVAGQLAHVGSVRVHREDLIVGLGGGVAALAIGFGYRAVKDDAIALGPSALGRRKGDEQAKRCSESSCECCFHTLISEIPGRKPIREMWAKCTALFFRISVDGRGGLKGPNNRARGVSPGIGNRQRRAD